jgi:hypothetical protein
VYVTKIYDAIATVEPVEIILPTNKPYSSCGPVSLWKTSDDIIRPNDAIVLNWSAGADGSAN